MIENKYGLPPIPFDDRLLERALDLKQLGLPWSPHVGCFVWDHHGSISTPSPFPKGIYFILSMKRFFAIFGDVKKMEEQLVWLPTWYQAIQLCRQLDITNVYAERSDLDEETCTPIDELMRLYELIAKQLEASSMEINRENRFASANNEQEWTRRVIESELGDLTHLPHDVQCQIESIYREVAKAYLGWRRIQEHQSDDWFPDERKLDSTLLDELGHFYSDYQHPIKSLKLIRQTAALLGAIDPEKDPENYQHVIDALLKIDNQDNSAGQILEKLSEPL